MSAEQGLASAVSLLLPKEAPEKAERLIGSDGRLYSGWTTTLASLIGMVFGPSSILVFCFSAFVLPLEAEFKWGISTISLGASLISLMIITTSVISGYLTDRLGARKLVLCSIPLFGLSVSALYFLPGNLYVFYAGLVLAALCGIGVWPVTYNKATASWFDKRLGLSLGLANTGIGIGAAVLPALVAYTIANFGWRTGYAVLGVLAIIGPWPVAFFMLKERRVKIETHDSADLLGISLRQAAKTREYCISAAGFFVLGTASSGAVIHMIRILTDAGLTPAEATFLQSVMGISLIVGRVCTGWFLDRLKVSVVMTTMCLAAGAGLWILNSSPPYALAAVAASLLGFVIGAEFDGLGYLIPRYFGQKFLGVIYGSIYAIFQIGAALSIAAFGFIRQSTGSYSLALTVVFAALMFASGLFLLLGRYRFLGRNPGG
ncbi:MFS transporter [Bradyrhizobium jicamae]|uniref:MFS transporter n=1 Tax=Bradyrhizobium jicamae TaxID=280332 RepID=UPI001BAACDAE|nr:MFS transporter [Bradyrhizobium jicamae]MBR0755739.1 MFS transporter [Bradyrhizobium jicamae]